jgi:hypothetical protein
MRRVLAILICAAMPGRAWAQDDFSHLKVKLGQFVYVTDAAAGVEVSGPLESLSPWVLTVDGYTFEPKPGLKIERRGDSLWNGALIGFGLGAFLFYPVVSEVGPAGAFRPINGCLWAGIGGLIDYAHVGRTTIYDRSSDAPGRSVRLVPDVGAHRKAVALAVRF